MKKGIVKYCVDVMMFIDLCSIAIIGLLMEFVIPSGQVAQAKKYFLGLHRHDWGEMHFFLGAFFLILLFVHLSFNWTFVTQSTKRYFGDNWQKALLGFSGGWIVVLIAAWMFIKV